MPSLLRIACVEWIIFPGLTAEEKLLCSNTVSAIICPLMTLISPFKSLSFMLFLSKRIITGLTTGCIGLEGVMLIIGWIGGSISGIRKLKLLVVDVTGIETLVFP